MDVDSAAHMRETLADMTLSYASDCSTGSNAAIFAFRGLQAAFADAFLATSPSTTRSRVRSMLLRGPALVFLLKTKLDSKNKM